MSDQLLAIDKGGIEIGVALAVARHGAADDAAEVNLGFARRAHRPAGFDRRRIGDMLDRKMLSVAQPHAKRDAAAAVTAALADVLGSVWRGRGDAAYRRLGIRIDVSGRPLLPDAAEKEIEQTGSMHRSRNHRPRSPPSAIRPSRPNAMSIACCEAMPLVLPRYVGTHANRSAKHAVRTIVSAAFGANMTEKVQDRVSRSRQSRMSRYGKQLVNSGRRPAWRGRFRSRNAHIFNAS